METARRGEDVTQVAAFPRRNGQTGNTEEIRIQVAEFNGKLLTSCRVWFKVKPTGPDDDGWRPSKLGFTIREHEVDTWVRALELVQTMLAERPGRRTRESRQDHAGRRREPWKPEPHTRSEVYRARPIADRLPTPEFDEFGGGAPDG